MYQAKILQIQECIENNDLGNAQLLLEDISTKFSEYKKAREIILKYIKAQLSNNNVSVLIPFCEIIIKQFPELEFERYMQDYIGNTYEVFEKEDWRQLQLDEEKIRPYIASGQSNIVRARAGSGKTRLITAKAIYEVHENNGDPSEVIILAFNNKIREELTKKMQTEIRVKGKEARADFQNIFTFHKLAKDIAGYSGQILAEEKQTRCVKAILEHHKKYVPKFRRAVYDFFLKDYMYVEGRKYSSISQYYRNMHEAGASKEKRYKTLNGEVVKSIGEKWIADFLFQHGVRYKYEKEILICGDNYKPDFEITRQDDKKFVWEHWALDSLEDIAKDAQAFEINVGCSPNEYWARKQEKIRAYPKNKYYTGFIQTTVEDIAYHDRCMFEQKLATLLKQEFGFTLNRIPQEELEQKVWSRAIDGLTKNCTQAINRLQQEDDPTQKLESIKQGEYPLHIKRFWKLVGGVYKGYLSVFSESTPEYLQSFNYFNTDFPLLFKKARRQVLLSPPAWVQKLKWVFVDEFQDYSTPYYNLVKAILEVSNSKLMAVGDDWQSVNRFAGAKTKYFTDFSSYFNDAEHFELSTNYRSAPQIIEASNELMKAKFIGDRGAVAFKKTEGLVRLAPYNFIGKEVYEDICSKLNMKDVSLSYDKQKKIAALIRLLTSVDKEKSVMILHRTNQWLGKKNDNWQEIVTQFHPSAEWLTMHKSKGKEADIVIILDVEKEKIPKRHPSSEYFYPFEESEKTNELDELRLLYVAMTRAKKELYLIAHSNKLSESIAELEIIKNQVRYSQIL